MTNGQYLGHAGREAARERIPDDAFNGDLSRIALARTYYSEGFNVSAALTDRAIRDREEIANQCDAFRLALIKIKDEQGQVCANFADCEHRACNSSYTAWALADEALSKIAP